MDITQPAPKKDVLFHCLGCGRGLVPVVELADGSTALQLVGGIIRGRTPLECKDCGRTRTWKPIKKQEKNAA